MNDGGNGKRRERPMRSIFNSEEEDECERLEREAEYPKKIFKEDKKEMNTTNGIKFRIIRVDQDQRQCSANISSASQTFKENFLEPLFTSNEQGKVNFESQTPDLMEGKSNKEEVLKCEDKEEETMNKIVENGNAVKEIPVEIEMAEMNNANENDMQEDTAKIETGIINNQESLPFKKRKKPASKRNGGKQMLDKKVVAKNSIEIKERAQVLNYMKEYNRPFSIQNVFDGFKGEVKRQNLQKILESLVKEGELTSKDFNKLMIYMIHPNNVPGPPKEEIERLDKEMTDYQDKLNSIYEQINESKESKCAVLK
jgi:hypothetical protein